MSGTGPTVGGFTEFVTNQMAVPAYVLASETTTLAIGYAYNFASQWVNPALCNIPGLQGAWTLYALAVYNLAGDTLINLAQDAMPFVAYTPQGLPPTPAGQPPPPPLPYWQWLRGQYKVMAFVPGVVQSASDESTSTSFLVAKAFENYTIANLQNLKTPYGRAYLGIAQSYGTLWGLT